MSQNDIVIVGGGIVGACAAYYLARTGHKVVLLDQYSVPNDLSTSGDHARIFRYTYGKDLFYTDLAVRSLLLWKEFQKDVHEELYVNTGMLDIALKDNGYEEHCYRSLSGMKLPVHKMGPDEIRDRFRIFNQKAMRFAVFHPDGGMLWAKRAVTAFANAAIRRKVLIHANTKITAVIRGKDGIKELRDDKGRSWKGCAYLFATGPWSKELLSSYHIPLKITKQQLLYFRPPTNQGRYRPGHCPVFSCLSRGYYGFPVHIHGFMKIGDCRKGSTGKLDAAPQETTPQFEKSCRSFLKQFMPDVSGFVDTEGKTCYYNNTPDGDFILDHLPDAPNAYVATGFSGHGFKFGPLLGKTAAELLTGGKPEINLTRFRLGRLRGCKSR